LDPNRATRVALVGAGFIADFHLEILKRLDGVEVVAVGDVDGGRAAGLARRHDIPRWFGSTAELVEKAKPDVAHVLVPPDLHASVARELLEAGVGVFLEKPMATAAADARALVELARTKNLPLGVNQNQTFHPGFVALKRLVEQGKLGKIDHVFSCLSVPLRQLQSRDFSHWMFRTPQNIVFEQATHPLSQLVQLLGPCRDVTAVPAPAVELAPGVLFHDRWQLALTHERGTATLLLSFGRDFAESFLRVLGQDGSVHVDLLRGHVTRSRKTPWPDFADQFWNAGAGAWALRGAAWRNAFDYVLSTLKLKERSDLFYVGLRASIAAFHAAARGGATLQPSAAEALEVVACCEAATAAVARNDAPRPASAAPTVPAVAGPATSDDVVVTGAAGFLGRHMTGRLLTSGRRVRALVRRPQFAPAELRRDGVTLFAGDALDPVAVERATAGAAAVVHLATAAGSDPAQVVASMVRGARVVAEACVRGGVRRLVHVSSIAVYDLGEERDSAVNEDAPLDPRPERRGEYAQGKIAAERALADFARERGIELVIVRPGFVVGSDGPPQHSGVGLWTRDTQVYGWGGGRRPLPFVLVDDVADALVQCVTAPGAAGRSYNLVGDVGLTAREWVDALRTTLRRDFAFHPQSVLYWYLEELAKYGVKLAIGRAGVRAPSWRDLATRTASRGFDNERPKRELGWRPVADRATFLSRALPPASVTTGP
jgi:predicted dehydrogenase/nucleoside-diphosphate-sugar epimerase